MNIEDINILPALDHELEHFFKLSVSNNFEIPRLKKGEKPDSSHWLENGLIVYITYILAVETKRLKALHEGFELEDILNQIKEHAEEYVQFRDDDQTIMTELAHELFVDTIQNIDVYDIQEIWSNI